MIPITILSLLAIFFGYIGRDLFVGIGTDFSSNSLFTHPSHISLIEAEVIPTGFKLLPSVFTLFGAVLAYVFYNFGHSSLVDLSKTYLGRTLYKFFNSKYFIEVIYNSYIVEGGLKLGYILAKSLDKGLVEQLTGYGLSSTLSSNSKSLSKLDTGQLVNYTTYFVVVLAVLSLFIGMSINIDNNLQLISNIIDIRLIVVVAITFMIVLVSGSSNTNMENK